MDEERRQKSIFDELTEQLDLLREYKAIVVDLNATIASRDREIKRLQGQGNPLQSQVIEHEIRDEKQAFVLGDLEATIKNLKRELQQHDVAHGLLEDRQNETISVLNETIANRARQIAELDGTDTGRIEEQDEQIKELEASLAEVTSRKNCRRSTRGLQDTIAAVRKALDE